MKKTIGSLEEQNNIKRSKKKNSFPSVNAAGKPGDVPGNGDNNNTLKTVNGKEGVV